MQKTYCKVNAYLTVKVGNHFQNAYSNNITKKNCIYTTVEYSASNSVISSANTLKPPN